MKTHALTSHDGYFEDFAPGMLIRHARGKTVTEMDNVLLTNMVMNTAEGHFNEDAMRRAANGIFSQRVVFGGINLSMVLGLAAQDTAEQCLREVGLDKIRLSHPVFHGDTLYAYSEVLAVEEAADRADAGLVRFRHYGINQHDKLCVQAERTVLLKRKSHWGAR
ncbi:MaoC family dehydratase [Cupriavidus gilardii]|nr:MaoC family dehydratase [Cupriavidus gilardii]MBO4123301.1 MaoC family dehydratase [Cupriavidus gilardii]MCG5258741.1 MaoC family dehydratase [Cupriavidus gilardii]MDF9429259.1 MaoC family dehydratase [Cupriavidus gilardii]NSX04339.1 MaoC family dehydratase [Cupriavidus gilardii]